MHDENTPVTMDGINLVVQRYNAMNGKQASILCEILRSQQVAALGTLHDGQPFVFMVPYAVLPDGQGLVIHVSQLAAHTRDMLAHTQVSLMAMALPAAEVSAQATARFTIQGQAKPSRDSDPGHEQAKVAYLSRFPDSRELFGFSDFSLFIIAPTSVRVVAGFAQASTLSASEFAELLRNPQ